MEHVAVYTPPPPKRMRCTKGHVFDELGFMETSKFGYDCVSFGDTGIPFCMRCFVEFCKEHLGVVEYVNNEAEPPST